MKKYLFLSLLLAFLSGCTDKKLSHAEVVTNYYEAFNASDYQQVKQCITDSITIVEGEYVMPYSRDSFHEQFKWDSIFQPTYEIIELQEQDNQIIATVASSSKRYAFLKNDPLTCQFQISFHSDKITRLVALDCPGADWSVWQTERDSLVSWIGANHPELDGFIHDLSMKGARNYLKAIELYQNRRGRL